MRERKYVDVYHNFDNKAGNAYCTPAALPYSYCRTWQGAKVELQKLFVQKLFVRRSRWTDNLSTCRP